MNSCKINESIIHQLVENELTASQEIELREHINSCKRCSKIMEDYLEIKALAERKLSEEIKLRDEADFIQTVVTAEKIKRNRHIFRKVLKITFATTAAGFAVIIIGIMVFIKFYFARTFANDISDSVLRCSKGLKVKEADGKIEPLTAAHHLKKGDEILTPEGARSFISFNGVRLLSKDASEIKVKGSRRLALLDGDVAIESSRGKEPLSILLGDAVVLTSDSSIRVSGNNNLYSIACITGTASVKAPGNKGKEQLKAGQTALVAADKLQMLSSTTDDLFAFRRQNVLDRIRERFDRIMAKYIGKIPAMRLGLYPSAPRASDWTNGLQFVSYMESGFAAAARGDVKRSAAEYYESLFAPGNRSITIGRQRAVRLEPGDGAGFPRWSHDGSMIAFIEVYPGSLTGIARIAKLDDLDNPWDISQEYDYSVRSMFPPTWAPDDQHVIFQVETGPTWDERGPTGNFALVIVPVDPSSGPPEEFLTPFYEIPLPLPLPVGKTISPSISSLPWGDAMVCSNWGNMVYVPVEEDGQPVRNAPGIFLTDFNPRHVFVMGGGFSPSGSMLTFTAVKDFDFDHMNAYILYDVDDILDGFSRPPRSLDDPRIRPVAPTNNMQFTGGFSFDESLVFAHEDINHAFRANWPTMLQQCDFDILYTSAQRGEPAKPIQIHLPGNQMFLSPSPEGNRICYSNFDFKNSNFELRVVSFDIEADIDNDLGGVLIDNSGTNLIVPPGALQQNFAVRISTPFAIQDEAEMKEGEDTFFAMRLIDAKGIENPQFIEPMTLTIRYTDEEVAGLDEGMLEIYYYDESDPAHPVWVPLGGTVDPENNEITLEIKHFSKYAVGPAKSKK
jgi:hypothetical protein